MPALHEADFTAHVTMLYGKKKFKFFSSSFLQRNLESILMTYYCAELLCLNCSLGSVHQFCAQLLVTAAVPHNLGLPLVVGIYPWEDEGDLVSCLTWRKKTIVMRTIPVNRARFIRCNKDGNLLPQQEGCCFKRKKDLRKWWNWCLFFSSSERDNSPSPIPKQQLTVKG